MQYRAFITVFLLVLLTAVQVPLAADKQMPDGNKLLEQCIIALRTLDAQQGNTNAWFATGWCLGYVLGFGDGHLMATDTTIPDDIREALMLCGLDQRGITAEQTVRILVEWLRTHPKVLDLPRNLLTALAFADAFPCPSAGTPQVSGRQPSSQPR